MSVESSSEMLGPSGGPQDGFGRRSRYALITIGFVLVCQSVQVLPVFRSVLWEYLDIGPEGFGLLVSIGSVTGLLVVLPGGALVDRWGPRAVLRICFLGIAGAMLLIALSDRRWSVLLFALATYGLFAHPLMVAVNSYLVQLFPSSQRRVLSLNLAAGSIGGIIYPGLAEGLLKLTRQVERFTFSMALHLPFAVGAAILLPATLIYRGGRRFGGNDAPVGRWSWKDLAVPSALRPVVLLVALHGAADSVLYLWMSPFLDSASFAAVPIGPGYVLSWYAVAYMVSRAALVLLPEDWGKRALLVAPGLLGGAVLVAGILSRNYRLTAYAYVLGAFLWSAEYPAMVSVLARRTSGRFGAALAMCGIGASVLTFLGVTGMGWLVGRLPGEAMWRAMALPAFLFPCISIGAAMWLIRDARK